VVRPARLRMVGPRRTFLSWGGGAKTIDRRPARPRSNSPEQFRVKYSRLHFDPERHFRSQQRNRSKKHFSGCRHPTPFRGGINCDGEPFVCERRLPADRISLADLRPLRRWARPPDPTGHERRSWAPEYLIVVSNDLWRSVRASKPDLSIRVE
jgi:hypothetical protein